MTKILIKRDSTSTSVVGNIPISDDKFTDVLVADTDTTLVVPPDVTSVFFAFTANTYVGVNTVVTLPTSGGFADTGGELNPGTRSVIPGDTLHFRSATEAEVSVSFFKDVGN